MAVFDNAQEIAKNGMKRNEVFAFFDRTNRDIVDHIGLFQTFGIDQNVVWDLYEEWQVV